jgi:surface antigen
MNRLTQISAAAIGLAAAASLAACSTGPDPYGQRNAHVTTTAPSQQYVQSYMQPSYVPPGSAQTVYVQPAYVQQQYAPPPYGQAAYDPISQSEGASIAQGTCDRGLLAGSANGSANQYIGAAAGPLVAGAIQSAMTPVDNGCVGLTLEYAHNNQPIIWTNVSSGTQYQVTPIRAYQAANGLNCREYTTLATQNGNSLRVNDAACRGPNGLWQLQS